MLPEGFEARMRALLGSEYEDFLASFGPAALHRSAEKSAQNRLYGRFVAVFALSRAVVPDGVLL